MPAPLDSWVEIASSPGGRLVMAHHRPDYTPELLELDAGTWGVLPLPPAADGGAIIELSIDIQAETLRVASAEVFPTSGALLVQLHRWTDAGWEELATGAPQISSLALAVAQDDTAFLIGRADIAFTFGVYRADGGAWEQLGTNIAGAYEA